jgi:hypothetical protein
MEEQIEVIKEKFETFLLLVKTSVVELAAEIDKLDRTTIAGKVGKRGNVIDFPVAKIRA